MSFVHTTRRGFLVGAGAALVGLPFLELLGSRGRRGGARADGGKVGDRVVFFYYPHGKFDPYWDVDGAGDRFSLRAGSILEPLGPHLQSCVFVRGVDFKDVSNHGLGMINMLTGGGTLETVGAGASVDWYLATQLGVRARYPWLGFGAIPEGGWGTQTQTCPFTKAPFVFLPTEKSPLAAWQRLFGDLAGGDLAGKTKHRLRVVDRVRGDLQRLHARLGGEEQAKLEQHLASLRQIEQSLTFVAGACAPGSQPPALDADLNAAFPDLVTLQIDIAVAALACGMTRVAAVQCSHTAAELVMSWAPVGTLAGHHELSHSDRNNTTGHRTFVECQRWYMAQFRHLLDRLAATPDPQRGGNLLQSSVVVACTELGDPQLHTCADVPFVLAGGGNGAFVTGRYLDFHGAPHQQLLVSIGNAMGVMNESFGKTAYGTGPLPGLLA